MLELFISYTCPYCRKVMNYFDENGIDYIKNDVSLSENYSRLLEIGGKDQIPFLHDADKQLSLYESDDIINFVRENVQ